MIECVNAIPISGHHKGRKIGPESVRRPIIPPDKAARPRRSLIGLEFWPTHSIYKLRTFQARGGETVSTKLAFCYHTLRDALVQVLRHNELPETDHATLVAYQRTQRAIFIFIPEQETLP